MKSTNVSLFSEKMKLM